MILEKVKAAAFKVKGGESLFERDSVALEKPTYPYQVLAWLLRAAIGNGCRLNVLDFGGALGSSYFQCRAFLGGLEEVRWSVVEQKNVVSCGKEHFEDDHLRFYYSIDECLERERVQVILLSAVVQYLEDPHAFLEDLAGRKIKYMLFDRTPVVPDISRDVLKIQRVPKDIYEASYPVWFLERKHFLTHFSENYKMLAEFESFESWELGSMTLQHVGFVFQTLEETGWASNR